MSIPLTNIIKIETNVLPPGNSGNNLYGLLISKKTILPANLITSVTNPEQVGQLYEFDSLEYELAETYFNGFDRSPKTPGALYLASYYNASAPASLIGGSVAYVDLEDLKSFTGPISINVDGVLKTASDVDLSKANSFSGAAAILSKALGVTVSFSVSTASFVVTSSKIDNSSSVDFASGGLATSLRLTQAEQAIKSPAVINPTVKSLLDKMRAQSQQFCTVFLSWIPDQTEAMNFSQWADTAQPKNQVAVIINDNSKNATSLQTGASLGEKIAAKQYNNTILVYDNFNLCAALSGFAASLDTDQENGRHTAAFRRNSKVTPNVIGENEAKALEANGYNYYGYYANAFQNEDLRFVFPGIISGEYINFDSWICQVYIYRRFQRAFAELLLNTPQIPYNADGQGLISASMVPAITDMLKFGAICSGVTLTQSQNTYLKSVDLTQDNINSIYSKGYVYFIGMSAVSGEDRAKGKSPPIAFFYTDGGSVRRINMTATEIQ